MVVIRNQKIYNANEKEAPSPNPDSKTANGLSLAVLQQKTEGPEVSMGPTKKKWLEVDWDGGRTGPFFSFSSFSFSLIVQL
jgi:hypothetical protein